MSKKLETFCKDIHRKLCRLDSRMESLKLNCGPTWHRLQEKLIEIRVRGDVHRQSVDHARTKLEQWFDDKRIEVGLAYDGGMEDGSVVQADEQAQRAEAHAVLSIEVANASIDEAERMILEAISARLNSEAKLANDEVGKPSSNVRHSISPKPVTRH